MNSAVRAVLESKSYKQILSYAELVSQHNLWEDGLKLPAKNRWYLSKNGVCLVQCSGYYTIVDEDDMILFEDHCYHTHIGDASIHVRGGYSTYLHRVIAQRAYGDIPNNMNIDHINGCTFDNRRSNLRITTRSENNKNRKKHANNSSGIAGVCWNKAKGKWKAYIKSQGRLIHLGYYDSLEEARAARLTAEASSGSLYRCNN